MTLTLRNIKWMVHFIIMCVLLIGCNPDGATPPPGNLPTSSAPLQSASVKARNEPSGDEISTATVQSIQFAEFPAGDGRREPLRTDHSEDRKIISRIVDWIRTSDPGQLLTVNEETTVLMRPRMQLGLQLTNGKNVNIEPVCTEKMISHETDCHVEEGLVYLYEPEEKQPSAILSPQLAAWLDKDYRYETVTLIHSEGPRAAGSSDGGTLKLVAQSKERVQNIGAPSCRGIEDDYQISGSYEMVYSNPDGSSQTVVQTFKDLVMIQPDLNPVVMKQLTFDGFEAFYFIPQYADCHGLEFYLYGVQNGRVFPFIFQLDGIEHETFAVSPIRVPQVIGGKLVVDGGTAAGMDYPIRYTFRPDVSAKTMVLIKREEIRS